jgi:hypothetical protein
VSGNALAAASTFETSWVVSLKARCGLRGEMPRLEHDLHDRVAVRDDEATPERIEGQAELATAAGVSNASVSGSNRPSRGEKLTSGRSGWSGEVTFPPLSPLVT